MYFELWSCSVLALALRLSWKGQFSKLGEKKKGKAAVLQIFKSKCFSLVQIWSVCFSFLPLRARMLVLLRGGHRAFEAGWTVSEAELRRSPGRCRVSKQQQSSSRDPRWTTGDVFTSGKKKVWLAVSYMHLGETESVLCQMSVFRNMQRKVHSKCGKWYGDTLWLCPGPPPEHTGLAVHGELLRFSRKQNV